MAATENTLFSFMVPGIVRPKARPRYFSGSGRVYTPATTKAWEETIKLTYLEARQKSNTRPPERYDHVYVHIVAIFRIPKSKPKWWRRLAGLKQVVALKGVDVDNIAKAVLDALNGLAYEDDRYVSELRVQKVYGPKPGVFIHLEYKRMNLKKVASEVFAEEDGGRQQ